MFSTQHLPSVNVDKANTSHGYRIIDFKNQIQIHVGVVQYHLSSDIKSYISHKNYGLHNATSTYVGTSSTL